jgi:SpoIID/LytB domain protein
VAAVAEGRVIPTVFSACCGGWSENNDTVWSGPPNGALRAVADLPKGANPAPKGLEGYGIVKWLTSTPKAYCSVDKDGFRWKRRYSQKELSALVNKVCAVGTVRAVAMGDRGPGGRLKSVKITGSKGSQVIQKELAIRRAFGGLPSAMCIINTEKNADGSLAFTIRGGGRGHGVGLCQQGARGMALQGAGYADIVRHYFTGAEIERLK